MKEPARWLGEIAWGHYSFRVICPSLLARLAATGVAPRKRLNPHNPYSTPYRHNLDSFFDQKRKLSSERLSAGGSGPVLRLKPRGFDHVLPRFLGKNWKKWRCEFKKSNQLQRNMIQLLAFGWACIFATSRPVVRYF